MKLYYFNVCKNGPIGIIILVLLKMKLYNLNVCFARAARTSRKEKGEAWFGRFLYISLFLLALKNQNQGSE